MGNAEIAEVLEGIASLLERRGESVFKVRAYRRVARTIEDLPVEVEELVREGEDLQRLPGVGKAISRKIAELVSTGRLEYYERLKREGLPIPLGGA